jgi:triosephosphate isomerase
MRKQIVAGNWKMNKTLQEGIDLAKSVNAMNEQIGSDVGVIVAPPFIHLSEVSRILTGVGLSAQDCAAEASGAFTGEVSAEMVRSAGAAYVIVGHSERRTIFGEDNAMLNKKVKMALENDLIPIFCCGEVLEERESGKLFEVVKTQIEIALFDLDPGDMGKIIIAYEPVWAIGTGVVATPQQAQEMHAYIRKLVRDKFGDAIAEDLTILYGGSCKPSNARVLFANPDVDGGLIGGASLDAEDFIAIVQSF